LNLRLRPSAPVDARHPRGVASRHRRWP
jgi:hypothetical protein